MVCASGDPAGNYGVEFWIHKKFVPVLEESLFAIHQAPRRLIVRMVTALGPFYSVVLHALGRPP